MIEKNTYKVISVLILAVFCLLAYGAKEYYDWELVKTTVAEGGFPWQCGAYQITTVQKGCVMTNASCSCSFCQALCVGSTQVVFAGQENCGTTFACIAPEVIPSGGPLETSEQAILAGTSNLITGNGIVATQSVAANYFEKIYAWADKYIIAVINDQ